MTLSPITWTLLTGTLLPIVVAALTHIGASARYKAVAGLVVAALATLVERVTLVDGSARFTTAIFVDLAAVYGMQLLSYLGFWKNMKLNDKILPEHGLG